MAWHGIAWWTLAWHGIWYGLMGIAWPGGHGMGKGIAWRAWHSIWYRLTMHGMIYGIRMSWYVERHSICQSMNILWVKKEISLAPPDSYFAIKIIRSLHIKDCRKKCTEINYSLARSLARSFLIFKNKIRRPRYQFGVSLKQWRPDMPKNDDSYSALPGWIRVPPVNEMKYLCNRNHRLQKKESFE